MNPTAHTRIRPEGGLEEVAVRSSQPQANIIDPPSAYPARQALRYSLIPRSLGRLEAMARSRFEISELTRTDPEILARWDPDDHELAWNVVHTVHASSQIEGEGVHAKDVPQIFHAVTRSESFLDDELEVRMAAEVAINRACYWAINEDRRPIVDLEFLLELHRRMFESSRRELAGRLKTKTVIITDDTRTRFNVTTLPAEKTPAFLTALCERTNAALYQADRYAAHSKLLVIAEFILDFLAIHPFEDGNGRTARLLSTYLLVKCGYYFPRFYPLERVLLETKSEYYSVLFNSQLNWYQSQEDLSTWIEYYIDALFIQWERAFANIRDSALKQKEVVDPHG